MADPTVATDAATKNYVDTQTAAFFSTGDAKITLKIVADAGWLLCDDGTFGSASSGSSNRSNADTQALFNLFFNNLTDTAAPILTSGGAATTRAGQVSASNAWAANCRMSLTKTLGRAIAIAGSGAGLTARPLGSSLGEENHILTVGEIPALTSTSGGNTITSTSSALFVQTNANPAGFFSGPGGNPALIALPSGTTASASAVTSTGGTGTISVTSTGTNGTAHNNMQPTTFFNFQVKL
jgi:microcystin-dependent protein